MNTKNLLQWALPLVFLACASSTPTVKQGPTRTETKQDINSIKTRFKKAYAELACLANPGVDPQMNVVPLHSPEEFLKRVQKQDKANLSLALEVLNKYGFFSIKAFFDAMERLKMDPDYWNSVQNGFLNDLQNCK